MGLKQANKKIMPLEGGFMVEFGNYRGMVYGGPYRQYTPGQRRLVGVKMAEEIDAVHDISIPTKDFSVPRVNDMQMGLIEAFQCIYEGNDIYVGCMGGIGRTGLFIGCMLKALHDFEPSDCLEGESKFDPVTMTRALYAGHAIETDEQMAYVREFDTTPIVSILKRMTAVQVITRDVIVKVPVRMTLWESIKSLFGGY